MKKTAQIFIVRAPITGTCLYRRWQGGREINPRYVPPESHKPMSKIEDDAIAEANAAGFTAVTVADITLWYVSCVGQWCGLPSRDRQEQVTDVWPPVMEAGK